MVTAAPSRDPTSMNGQGKNEAKYFLTTTDESDLS
jgi:hypothetical protein